MEFLITKKTLSPMRMWLIKNGLVKPKDLKETREVFTFPYVADQNPKPTKPLWVERHLIKMQHGTR